MAMDFSVKEAKQLIEQHKMLLSKLDYIVAKDTSIRTDVRQSANDSIMQSALRRTIVNNCNHPEELPARISDVDRLIYILHKYQKCRSAIETAKMFQSHAAENVRQNITLLNPGIGGLAWLFGGKRAKETASQAYQELTNALNENYGQIIPHLVSEIDSTAYTAMDSAWESFVATPYLFSDTLETLCPNILRSQENNPFQTLLVQLSDLDHKISKCQVETDQEKDQIKVAAEKMMAHNALQILETVPVEEVNREKAGYRVKTLRDAGFTTMADIYTASKYQLASLNGISDYAAYAMKNVAEDFLQEAREGVKIKLSADDRNKQATEVIKAIYIYRLKNACREELNQLVQSNQGLLAHAKNVLQAVGNGLPWLFYSSEQRADVRTAYADIKTAIDGEYGQTIAKLANILLATNLDYASDVVWDDFQTHNIVYISILEEIVPGALGNDDILYGLPEDLAREIQEEVFFPDGLLCTLRRYQEWGVKYILHQKKVLLGDEMGLGKTIQAIATMVSLRNTGATHFMVVCPASVVTNWCREVAKHSKLRVTKVHGTDRLQALKSWVKTGGVAVTTFETTAYIKYENIETLNLLVVDEAHYIKNPDANRSINVRCICDQAERLLFMTGTALENKVEEMVSLIHVLQPDIAEAVKNMTFMPSAPKFRNRVAPVYYRRKREDVLTELPELIETKEWCSLNPGEKEIYEWNVLSKNYAAARRLSWNADDISKSCKATRLLEIIEQAKAEDRKVLVFSFFLDTISTIGNLLGKRCYGPINGSVPPPRRQEIIDSFDKAPAGSVLLAQIQSGGTGLNIQSASVVVICEPQFKPSIENQAISRAYRMGQARNVLVHRLLCTDTIDEKLTDLLEHKQEIFDAFADKSVAAEQNESHNVEVDEKKFGQLIQEEIDRINAEKGGHPAGEAK
jgi:superfamily II DNA or RNA helicase